MVRFLVWNKTNEYVSDHVYIKLDIDLEFKNAYDF